MIAIASAIGLLASGYTRSDLFASQVLNRIKAAAATAGTSMPSKEAVAMLVRSSSISFSSTVGLVMNLLKVCISINNELKPDSECTSKNLATPARLGEIYGLDAWEMALLEQMR